MAPKFETELEFQILLASHRGIDCIKDDNCNILLFDDGTISGKVFVKPVKVSGFSTLVIKKLEDGDFKAEFKALTKIQEEFELYDLKDLEMPDAEKRLLYFLLLNREFFEKLNEEDKEKLKKEILK